jgi:hypothetical protein
MWLMKLITKRNVSFYGCYYHYFNMLMMFSLGTGLAAVTEFQSIVALSRENFLSNIEVLKCCPEFICWHHNHQ